MSQLFDLPNDALIMIKKSFADFCAEVAFLDGKPDGKELICFEVKLCCNGKHYHISWFSREDFAKDYCDYLNSKHKCCIPHYYYVSSFLITDF